ncbi:DUF2505 domain-containing protein [Polyangium sp. 6x1]|uniref:DUF2505 domain-containing protein n=1 Tax=Polyangium sp. 6x1 TaxID=3042689 RepID=UPI002482B969|nr:DUF2505 domain-containing protein [Polyangium sp. 6x1]MDI1449157.1 DUF2505 domain-containing protein [Polyangium sp. 6x1]
MGKFTVTHEINCDEETFWKIFFDKAFNEKLYRDRLSFPRFDILEQTETDTRMSRKVAGQPKMDVPAPVAKLLGSGFSYTEEGSFDKATKVWRWKLIPSTMADKVRNEGTMRIEPVGDKKVRRIAEITIEAKVFGIGGLIESSTEKQLRDGWGDSAVFMNDWIKTHT